MLSVVAAVSLQFFIVVRLGYVKVIRSPQASTLYGLGPEGIRNIEKTFLQINLKLPYIFNS